MKFTTFNDYPEKIANALRRSNAHWMKDRLNNIFIIESRNLEEPLTNDEKSEIINYLFENGFDMCVIFK